jgi:hypothetical protein
MRHPIASVTIEPLKCALFGYCRNQMDSFQLNVCRYMSELNQSSIPLLTYVKYTLSNELNHSLKNDNSICLKDVQPDLQYTIAKHYLFH